MIVTVDSIPVDGVVVVSVQGDLRGGVTDPRLQPILSMDIVVTVVVVAVLLVAGHTSSVKKIYIYEILHCNIREIF